MPIPAQRHSHEVTGSVLLAFVKVTSPPSGFWGVFMEKFLFLFFGKLKKSKEIQYPDLPQPCSDTAMVLLYSKELRQHNDVVG